MKLSLPRLRWRRVRSGVEKCVSTRLRKRMWREKRKIALMWMGRAGGRRGLRRVGIELSLKRIKEVIQDIFMLPREPQQHAMDLAPRNKSENELGGKTFKQIRESHNGNYTYTHTGGMKREKSLRGKIAQQFASDFHSRQPPQPQDNNRERIREAQRVSIRAAVSLYMIKSLLISVCAPSSQPHREKQETCENNIQVFDSSIHLSCRRCRVDGIQLSTLLNNASRWEAENRFEMKIEKRCKHRDELELRWRSLNNNWESPTLCFLDFIEFFLRYFSRCGFSIHLCRSGKNAGFFTTVRRAQHRRWQSGRDIMINVNLWTNY